MLKGKQYFVMEEIFLVNIRYFLSNLVNFFFQGCIFTFTRKPDRQVIVSACMSESQSRTSEIFLCANNSDGDSSHPPETEE